MFSIRDINKFDLMKCEQDIKLDADRFQFDGLFLVQCLVSMSDKLEV
jgi:hypothetical protein